MYLFILLLTNLNNKDVIIKCCFTIIFEVCETANVFSSELVQHVCYTHKVLKPPTIRQSLSLKSHTVINGFRNAMANPYRSSISFKPEPRRYRKLKKKLPINLQMFKCHIHFFVTINVLNTHISHFPLEVANEIERNALY